MTEVIKNLKLNSDLVKIHLVEVEDQLYTDADDITYKKNQREYRVQLDLSGLIDTFGIDLKSAYSRGGNITDNKMEITLFIIDESDADS